MSIPQHYDDVTRIRFWAKVGAPDANGCWPWLAALHRGYGNFYLDGKTIAAHRASWRIHRGPITVGLTVDHLCRNRACVNPDHLEPVTIAENVMRGEGPPARNARKTTCHVGHPLRRDARGRHCNTCANAARRARTGTPNWDKTECPSGHPYDEANTRWFQRDGSWRRFCRECNRISCKARRHARKAAA